MIGVPYPWASAEDVYLHTWSWLLGCLLTTVPKPVSGPTTGLGTWVNSAKFSLLIKLKRGLSLILWTSGFKKSMWVSEVLTLKPSDGMRWVVSCFGILWSLLSGFGIPVEVKQLIDGSNLRLYKTDQSKISNSCIHNSKFHCSFYSKSKICNLPFLQLGPSYRHLARQVYLHTSFLYKSWLY